MKARISLKTVKKNKITQLSREIGSHFPSSCPQCHHVGTVWFALIGPLTCITDVVASVAGDVESRTDSNKSFLSRQPISGTQRGWHCSESHHWVTVTKVSYRSSHIGPKDSRRDGWTARQAVIPTRMKNPSLKQKGENYFS